MQTIYLVCATCGEYSDRTDWNVCAFQSEEAAKNTADKLNQLVKFEQDFHKKEVSEFDSQWDKLKPAHPQPSAKFLEAKNACAFGNGSLTEKKRYALEQELHIKAKEAWKQDHQNWWSKRNAALQEWRKEHYQLPPHLVDVKQLDERFSCDAEYDYQAIELLDGIQ